MRFFKKIIHWAESEETIRAILLQGSRAREGDFDEFSDYDLVLVCQDAAPYTKSDEWLERIAPVWVCVKEERKLGGRAFPTRLVIFEGGVKVDFSFFPTNALDLATREGGQVVLDKDHLLRHLSDLPKPKKPSEREFLRVVEEFWFEAYHVAITLKRGDLWSVKFRSSAMHAFLLRMIEWDAEAGGDWERTSPPLGKKMQSWASPEIYRELDGVFAHFDAEDSKRALLHTLPLFRRLAQRLSNLLRFVYPTDLDRKMTQFIVVGIDAT